MSNQTPYGKRKHTANATPADSVRDNDSTNRAPSMEPQLKKARVDDTRQALQTTTGNNGKMAQEVAIKLAMDLLQQFSGGDSPQHAMGISSELLFNLDQVMAHTKQFVDFVQRHAPTPYPASLGLFCVFSTEVLLYMFSFLRPRDLLRVRLVCTVFAAISRDQSLWRILVEKDFSPIHNKMHLQLGKSWEWLYKCKAIKFADKQDIRNHAVGSHVDQSLGLNERYEGEWGRDVQMKQQAGGWLFSRGGYSSSAVGLNGYGLFIDENNILREGQWSNGKVHGLGREVATLTRTLHEYIGNFTEGLWEGEGKCTYVDGREYQGQWLRGQRHGYGVMTYPDKRRFEGQWVMGEREGEGLLIWPTGAKYSGIWRSDVMQGGGTFNAEDSALTVSAPTLEEAFTSIWLQIAKLSGTSTGMLKIMEAKAQEHKKEEEVKKNHNAQTQAASAKAQPQNTAKTQQSTTKTSSNGPMSTSTTKNIKQNQQRRSTKSTNRSYSDDEEESEDEEANRNSTSKQRKPSASYRGR